MAEAADELGFNGMDFILLSPDEFIPYKNLKHIKHKCLFPFSKYEELFHRYRIIEKNINLGKYDRIILRYPSADASGIDFMRKYDVVTEHHNKELEENKLHLQSDISLPERMLKHIRIKLLEKYHSKIIENAIGIIAISNDVAEYEAKFAEFKVPYKSIPNGINTKSIRHTKYKPFNGNTLDIAFMASEKAPWHGLHRILSSLKNFSGKENIRLHLIGKKFHTVPLLNEKVTIICHGKKWGLDLDDILSQMNVAISSMSLYLQNMTEGSCLKTREYTARGLPFIIGHNDYDLRYVDKDKKFFIQFPNNDSLIDFEKVVDFASRMSKRCNEISAYMRTYSSKYMDWKLKLKQYLFQF